MPGTNRVRTAAGRPTASTQEPVGGIPAFDYVGRTDAAVLGRAKVVAITGVAALAACVMARLRRLATG